MSFFDLGASATRTDSESFMRNPTVKKVFPNFPPMGSLTSVLVQVAVLYLQVAGTN